MANLDARITEALDEVANDVAALSPAARHFGDSITLAGGSDWWGAPDPFTLCYSSSSAYTMAANRIHYVPMYVSHPLQSVGAFCAQSRADADPLSVIRTGIYKLGAPSGNSWAVGDRVLDFGVQSAAAAGHKMWDLVTPVTLERGWYFMAVGIASASTATADRGQIVYSRWMLPGMNRVYPYSSGASARPRTAGPSYFVYENNKGSEIQNGFPAVPTSSPATDSSSTNGFALQMVQPKWRSL